MKTFIYNKKMIHRAISVFEDIIKNFEDFVVDIEQKNRFLMKYICPIGKEYLYLKYGNSKNDIILFSSLVFHYKPRWKDIPNSIRYYYISHTKAFIDKKPTFHSWFLLRTNDSKKIDASKRDLIEMMKYKIEIMKNIIEDLKQRDSLEIQDFSNDF